MFWLLMIPARPFPLLLAPTTILATLGKTTRTCPPLAPAFELHVSLLIRATGRLCTPLYLATTTAKRSTPALIPVINQLPVNYFRQRRTIFSGHNQLAGDLLSFGYLPSLRVLELEHNQMYHSILDDLYESLITEVVHSLFSDYTFRMMQGTYIYWNLRLTCDYAHQEGEHKLRGLTMHGLWLSRISGSRVVHLSKNTYGDEWCADLKTAESLIGQLDPEVKSKMDLHWYSIIHTSESKKLWIEQMCKHGYLSCKYWEKAIEAAMPFLSSNGILNIMKILKEEMFLSGNYTSQELQDALYKRTCRRIDIKFKRMNGKTYPSEFGLLHDSKLNFLNYPSKN